MILVICDRCGAKDRTTVGSSSARFVQHCSFKTGGPAVINIDLCGDCIREVGDTITTPVDRKPHYDPDAQ